MFTAGDSGEHLGEPDRTSFIWRRESYGFAAAQVLLYLALMRARPKLMINNSENFDIVLPWRARRVEKIVFRRADALLVFARTARERLLRLGAPPEKMRTLPQFGLDPEIFRPPEPGVRGDVFLRRVCWATRPLERGGHPLESACPAFQGSG